MPGTRRPIFPRWYFPLLAMLLVVWTAMEGVNVWRNRQAGEVYWISGPWGRLSLSDTGGWTGRAIWLPDGRAYAVVDGCLWWVRDRPPELLRCDSRGAVRVYEPGDSLAGGKWLRVRKLTPAPAGLWLACGDLPGFGDADQMALFQIDPEAGTYREVPGMVDAVSSDDGRQTAMLGLDGAVHLTGAGVDTVTCPPYRIIGLKGAFAQGKLLLTTRTGREEQVGVGPGPAILVDLLHGTQSEHNVDRWPNLDRSTGEWWVAQPLYDPAISRAVVYDPSLKRVSRRIWVGVFGYMIDEIGHVGPAEARLFDAVANLSEAAIANAPRIHLREAKAPSTAKTP